MICSSSILFPFFILFSLSLLFDVCLFNFVTALLNVFIFKSLFCFFKFIQLLVFLSILLFWDGLVTILFNWAISFLASTLSTGEESLLFLVEPLDSKTSFGFLLSLNIELGFLLFPIISRQFIIIFFLFWAWLPNLFSSVLIFWEGFLYKEWFFLFEFCLFLMVLICFGTILSFNDKQSKNILFTCIFGRNSGENIWNFFLEFTSFKAFLSFLSFLLLFLLVIFTFTFADDIFNDFD